MQILGKKSKILLIAVAITMLVAVGVSFATWDTSAVKAMNGDLSNYANAKVGDIIEFGRYYQTGNKVSNAEDAEYEKTPIEWIVVDKDERTGQITLMSKYILAAGSYFGNWYYDQEGKGNYHYNEDRAEIAGISNNQAYVESTIRAYLNNLERRDLGGDSYSTEAGYKTSVTASVSTEKLLTSVGFSNSIYTFTDEYQRPIANPEYRNRPATRGFYDEAFNNEEKSIIVPKVIAGYIGHRWPNNMSAPTKMSYVEGAVDKVWIASATELNALNNSDIYPYPSEDTSTKTFEYFKNKSSTELQNSLKTARAPFAMNNSKAMNYSIPIYNYQSTEINENIHVRANSMDYYWTRSPLSSSCANAYRVTDTGLFDYAATHISDVGVRPCVILKY